jgi:hypothetical protein
MRTCASHGSIGKLSSWLGLKEYQVRDYRSKLRHFILVFCAYTFILWHTKTCGLRRHWASKPLNTFAEALGAFRTAMSFPASGVIDLKSGRILREH